MDILLICNFWHFEFEKKSSRYRTMAEVLAAQPDFEVEVVSSTFRHQTKKQRDTAAIAALSAPYKVTLLKEPSYRKNVSLKRLYAHHRFAKEVTAYLKRRKRPDVIICSVPSLAVGSAVTKFAKKQGIKVMIDIQDLWPEAFKMALPIPVLSDLLFAPMRVQADRIYARADAVMAVSDTYVKRGLQCNPQAEGIPLFIGTDSRLATAEMQGKTVDKPAGEFWVSYVGALGHSYAIDAIIDAIALLNQEGYTDIVFKVMGEGVLEESFKAHAAQKGVACDFTGFLDYGTMMAILTAGEVAVNPIVGKSVSSIINKVSDYAMAGVPVVNTQKSAEYRQLLEEYHAGITAENEDPSAIAAALRRLHDNADERRTMGENQKRLFNERFDRAKTYAEVVNAIHRLAAKK